MKKALLFEVNPYHQVMLPGLLYDLIQMGFEVDLLVREGINCEDVLVRIEEKYNIYYYNDNTIKSVCKSLGGLNSYNYILFSSLEYYHDGIFESAYDYLSRVEEITTSFAGIIHNPDKLEDINAVWMLSEHRVFSLSPSSYMNNSIETCIPTFFGAYDQPSRNTKKIFLVGQSNDINYLASQIQITIDFGIENFSVICVGKYKRELLVLKYLVKRAIDFVLKIIRKEPKYNLKYSLKAFRKIEFVGTLSYEEMFKIIEECSFIDIAMNPSVSSGFYTGRTTGALLLAYGFSKPCIMEQRFAKAYCLNESQSVIYSNMQLGLVEALKMNDEQYREMVNEFEIKRKLMEHMSIENLQKAIND